MASISRPTTFFLGAGFLFTAVGVVAGLAWIPLFAQERAFEHAVTTTGTVAGNRTEFSLNSSPSSDTAKSLDYFVRFRYTAEGKSFEVEQQVHRAVYRADPYGKTVPVYYLARKPAEWVRSLGQV